MAGWDPGDPNSINRSYRRAIDTVLDAVDREDPLFVAVAGDLVEGHWGEDADGTGIFGPVGTEEERLAAIRRAGHLYYGQWQRRFERRGLLTYPAVGDHEIGDDLGGRPLWDRWPAGTFRHRAVPTYKAVWAENFTWPNGAPRFTLRPLGTQWESTAYAVYPTPDMLLVTLDVFRYDASGVQPTVTEGQLAWLDALLADAEGRGVENVIVQGHVPVLGPVRSLHSGRLSLLDGGRSALWRTLKAHDVDMYMCGEVHAVTAIVDDGLLQVCHGGLIAYGGINYMLATVYENGRVDLEVKRFKRTSIDRERRLWQTSLKRQNGAVRYKRRPRRVAGGRYGGAGGFRRVTGMFRPYAPPH